jgi:DNA repair photolyase
MIINTGSRTDIPAFFHKWFLNRIDEGFVCTRNPYNDDIYRYPLDSKIIDCLCFCTKNPKPLLKNVDKLDDFNQFWFVTITPYGRDIEVNVPSFRHVIKSFKQLSEYLGVNRVSWRYDPIFITEKYSLDFHIDRFEEMASQLSDYTADCTISFIDLYAKVLRNFPQAREVTSEERLGIGEEFSKIAGKYDIRMKTCVEGTLLDRFGFDSSGCMTQNVIEKAIGNNLKIPKGKYRIRECDCIFGRDIGAYNTCLHGCRYCYANFSTKLVKRNFRLHNPDSPLLIGDVKEGDVVKEVNEPSYIETHEKVVPITSTFQSTLL